ncbi:MAG: hypothetical protein HYX48_00705 [Chlamydiales bacterium]|nr:hypothetical protein [Chlamydiales bacterium]
MSLSACRRPAARGAGIVLSQRTPLARNQKTKYTSIQIGKSRNSGQSKPASRQPIFSSNQSQSVQNRAAHLTNWLYFERYANGVAPRPNNPLATYTEVDSAYRPGSPLPCYELPTYKIPSDLCSIVLAPDADLSVITKYLKRGEVHLPIFPQLCGDMSIPKMAEITKHPKSSVQVAPTASTRTVFVLEEDAPAHCLKTSLGPLRITRAVRGLDKTRIDHSIAVSKAISGCSDLVKNPKFAFLHESFGASYGHQKDSIGFLVREMIPRPFIQEKHSMLPLFGLYSKDTRNPEARATLINLIEASDHDPETFVLESIYYPIIRGWVEIYLKTGAIIEAHGQNVSFEIDKDGVPGRAVFRDFDTFMRRKGLEMNGISTDGMNPFKLFEDEGTADSPKTKVIMSLVYDHEMGTPFGRIAKVCEEEYGIPVERLQAKCRTYIRQILPEADLHFPKDETYNNKPGPIEPGKRAVFVQTPDKPVWR